MTEKITRMQFTQPPEGAKQIHLYNFEDLLRPRGSMKKESFSLETFERLKGVYEDWLDEECSDSQPAHLIAHRLLTNMKEEIDIAIKAFAHLTFKDNRLDKEAMMLHALNELEESRR